MSSNAGRKFQNEKNVKKKYQKFITDQNETKSLFTTENSNSENIKNGEKTFTGFFDIKDFPELKVPGKVSSESKNFESKNQEWLPSLSSGNKKTLSKTFASVSICKNIEKDAADEIVKEKHLTATVTESGVSGATKGKKSTSSKKALVQNQRNPNKKKRTDPVLINFQDILTINKVQRKTKQHNIVKRHAQKFRDKDLLSGNLLDSSNPKRSRGKHREVKKKKLSHLKMTIIRERILKQKTRENPECDSFNLIDSIDFKTEINNYLNDLKQKKLKSFDASNNELKEDVNNKNKINEQNQDNRKTETDEKQIEKVTDGVKEKKIFSDAPEGELKFTRKFREYCNNIVTPGLNTAVTEFIKELIKLQDRLYLRDPIKAKARKKHVSGIREVKKYLTLKKIKMVIIAPNLEKLQMEGSVYDSINQLKSMAESQNVPYGFALDRYKLGKCTKKNVPISVFGILNYEGIETLHENVMRELLEAKRKFSELAGTDTEIKKEEKADDINSQIISSLISSFREELRMPGDDES